MKLKELLNDFCNKHVLGKPLEHVYTIESQKTWSPPCTCQRDKPREPSDYYKIVCAEIPDPTYNLRLHNNVKWCMIHSPYGSIRRKAPYMRDGKCTKKISKSFAEFTTTGKATIVILYTTVVITNELYK